MSYIVQDDIKGLLPEEFSLQALDDNGDGSQDTGLWDYALAAAQDDVDGRLGTRYTVPLTGTIPAVVKHATKILVLFYIYKRRGVGDDANPWAKDAVEQHTKLDKIGAGDLALTATADPANPGGTVIGEDSKLYDEAGRLMI